MHLPDRCTPYRDSMLTVEWIYMKHTFRKFDILAFKIQDTWPYWLRETIKVAARIVNAQIFKAKIAGKCSNFQKCGCNRLSLENYNASHFETFWGFEVKFSFFHAINAIHLDGQHFITYTTPFPIGKYGFSPLGRRRERLWSCWSPSSPTRDPMPPRPPPPLGPCSCPGRPWLLTSNRRTL